MRVLVRSLVALVTVVAAALAMPQLAAACLAVGPNTDTADLGQPDFIFFGTADSGGPPSLTAPITFRNVVVLRGTSTRPLSIEPPDSWGCRGPGFKLGDRVLVFGGGKPPFDLPLVWRIGGSGQLLPSVEFDGLKVIGTTPFRPYVNGRKPATLGDILGPYGLDVPDAAISAPGAPWPTCAGLLLLLLAVCVTARRLMRGERPAARPGAWRSVAT
jgi:hypothetical protein